MCIGITHLEVPSIRIEYLNSTISLSLGYSLKVCERVSLVGAQARGRAHESGGGLSGWIGMMVAGLIGVGIGLEV